MVNINNIHTRNVDYFGSGPKTYFYLIFFFFFNFFSERNHNDLVFRVTWHWSDVCYVSSLIYYQLFTKFSWLLLFNRNTVVTQINWKKKNSTRSLLTKKCRKLVRKTKHRNWFRYLIEMKSTIIFVFKNSLYNDKELFGRNHQFECIEVFDLREMCMSNSNSKMRCCCRSIQCMNNDWIADSPATWLSPYVSLYKNT